MNYLYIFFVCICIYAMKDLLNERYQVSYVNESSDENWTKRENYDYLICIPLKEFEMYANKTQIDLNQLTEDLLVYFSDFEFEERLNNSLNHLISKSSQSDSTNFESSSFNELELMISFIKLIIEIIILNPIQSKNFYVINHLFCIILDVDFDLNFEAATDFILLFINVEFPNIFQNISYFLFKKDISYFFKIEKIDRNIHEKIHQLVIINKPQPYSNCIEYDELNRKKYSKFYCVNQCYKEGFRLSKYFYTGNENGFIELNYKDNETIKQNEKYCFDKCKRDNCILTYVMANDFKISNDLHTKIFKAYPIISEFDFWIQFIGLILSFISISFFQIFLLSINFRQFKEKLIKNLIFIIKLIVFTIFLILFLHLTFGMYNQYVIKLENPERKELREYLFKPEAFNLIACFQINSINLTTNRSKLNFLKTFHQLENDTKDNFTNAISKIYLKFQNKKLIIDWRKTSKVYFLFKNEYELLSIYRCYQLEINPIEPKYQSLLSISKLVIELNNFNYQIFLIDKNQKFTTKSYKLKPDQSFVKIVKKKLKSNIKEKCLDYSELKMNCFCQQNCIDQCRSKNLFKDYSLISEDTLIDKDEFDSKLWNKKIEGLIKIDQIPENIIKLCNYSIVSCYETMYEDNKEIKLYKVLNDDKSSIIEVELYYDVITEIEEEPSFYKLLFDILNIQSILFGLNIFKLSKLIIQFLKIKFNLNHINYYLVIIYLICCFGFLIHIFFIFNEIISGKYIHSLNYEIPNEIEQPELIFCFEFEWNKTIDSNEKLNGYHLEMMTKKIRIDTVFDKIIYLNGSNNWIELSKETNLTNDEINIDTFYFLDKKCFEISGQEMIYKKSQFDFKDNTEVLKIYFNQQFIKQTKTALFLTKKKYTMALSKTVDLLFKDYYYYVNNENFKIDFKDKFNLIKNPLSIYYYLFKEENYLNDVNIYINRLINHFKDQFNSTTLNLPLESKNFQFDINDQLFEEFYRTKQNISDHKIPGNLNYQRQFALNHVRKEFKLDTKSITKPDFVFSLIFFNKKVQITNKDTYAKLLLSMLNALSLWFGFLIVKIDNINF